jgi:hypothetical protein
MSRKTGLVLLLIATTLCGVVLSITTWTLQERVHNLEAQVGRLEMDINLLPKVEESAINSSDLLEIAGAKEFGKADEDDRRQMIGKWCQKKLASWPDLNSDQQELLLYRLESQLDDLLAERDFETTKA